MKHSYKLSRLALRDIDRIWIYTRENWSARQADKYFTKIFKSIDALCENSNIGKSIEELKSNHRIFPVESHLIIYKVENKLVFIDRVLHKRMDIESILDQ